jgi:hypothetical protein
VIALEALIGLLMKRGSNGIVQHPTGFSFQSGIPLIGKSMENTLGLYGIIKWSV